MARRLNSEEVRKVLAAELAAGAARIRDNYGPQIGWEALQRLLADRTCVPYPCEVQFEAGPLLPGEFAHALPKGQTPAEGYTIYVHPLYLSQLSRVPFLVLPQLVMVHHGQRVTAEDAELFGATALGMSKEDYFQALCELSDQIGGDELM